MSTTNGGQAKEELILKPNFMGAKSLEDLKELMSLYECEIVVNVRQTDTAWLKRISRLERQGLVNVQHETCNNEAPYTVG